jgi:flagellar biosynthesis protein FliR
MNIETLSVEYIFQIFLIFLRIGFALSNIPVIGEKYINSKIRLAVVFFLCIIVHPFVSADLPKMQGNVLLIFRYSIFEAIIGLMIGLTAKIYFFALDIVGNLIGMQSGLSAASFFDPNQHGQVAIFSTFLNLVAIASFIASDVHHVLLIGVLESYKKFNIGEIINIGDAASFFSRSVNNSFILALKISSPFLICNIAIQVGSGILSRLMPNLQVFFILTPVQIAVTFAILAISLSEMIGALINGIINIT